MKLEHQDDLTRELANKRMVLTTASPCKLPQDDLGHIHLQYDVFSNQLCKILVNVSKKSIQLSIYPDMSVSSHTTNKHQ